MRKIIDLTRQRFGRLVVEGRSNNTVRGNPQWNCLCDCGTEKIISGGSLRNGSTKSCGCLNKELTILRNKKNIKHGYFINNKRLRERDIWRSMIERCNNQKNYKKYKNYGGRGIKVCWKWSNKNPKGFENFYKDVGNIPIGMSIDRINNNKGYFPNNWRLATQKQQNRNMRTNLMITFNNKTQCLKDWAIELNIEYHTLWTRIYKLDWPIEKAFTVPVRIRREKINA